MRYKRHKPLPMLEELESRTLLSANAATINADYSAFLAARTALSAGVATGGRDLTLLAGALSAELKNSKGTNARLLAASKSAGNKTLSSYKSLSSSFENSASSIASSLKSGTLAVLVTPNVKKLKTLSASAIKLNATAVSGLAKFDANTSLATLYTDLNTLVVDNPGDPVISNGVSEIESNVTAAGINALAATFAQDAEQLAADVRTITG